MGNLVAKAIMLLALPAVVFVSGVYIMSKLSGREYVTYPDAKPLNQRIGGYDVEEVNHYWGALDDHARMVEQHFLEMDLVFPFFYGAALASALLCVWASLGRPFHPLWLLLPVAITVVADWTENLVQLGQLQFYGESGKAGLQSAWIQAASAATIVKLVFFYGASLLLVYLAGWMIVRALTSPS